MPFICWAPLCIPAIPLGNVKTALDLGSASHGKANLGKPLFSSQFPYLQNMADVALHVSGFLTGPSKDAVWVSYGCIWAKVGHGSDRSGCHAAHSMEGRCYIDGKLTFNDLKQLWILVLLCPCATYLAGDMASFMGRRTHPLSVSKSARPPQTTV